MILALLPPDATLSEVLRSRARRTPVDRLYIDVVGGLVIGLATVWARFPGWGTVGSAALCLFAYGVWAVADRRLQPVPWPEQLASPGLWRTLRASAGVAGLVGFVSFLLTGLGLLLGSIVS